MNRFRRGLRSSHTVDIFTKMEARMKADDINFQRYRGNAFNRRVTRRSVNTSLFRLPLPHCDAEAVLAERCKTLAIGSYPVVTLEWARSRDNSFRDLRDLPCTTSG